MFKSSSAPEYFKTATTCSAVYHLRTANPVFMSRFYRKQVAKTAEEYQGTDPTKLETRALRLRRTHGVSANASVLRERCRNFPRAGIRRPVVHSMSPSQVV